MELERHSGVTIQTAGRTLSQRCDEVVSERSDVIVGWSDELDRQSGLTT